MVYGLTMNSTVHPRVCGEHRWLRLPMRSITGSSPRLRGTPGIDPKRDIHCRFIPASAGNTQDIPELFIKLAVHPRVCGEHSTMPLMAVKMVGSSPRLRGTPSSTRDLVKLRRFIPASAGNTAGAGVLASGNPVHPRVCGEHYEAADAAKPMIGSSPRLRGTRLPVRPLWRAFSVHPRVCGEHKIADKLSDTLCGSSPRLRGTRE